MKGFVFSLAADTSLRESPDGFFLLSRLPVRLLRLNQSLFHLIGHIQNGGVLSDFVKQNPGLDTGNLLKTLLSMVARGYLKLERTAAIASYPRVSIVIPVRDQPRDLGECLASLADLDYPKDRLEIIVVDDGSRKEVSGIITASGITILRQDKSLGPATCRNIGAAKAGGDILAFLDADCTADENWLKELIPFFGVSGVGAVGGYVDNYYKNKYLDRYETTASSLNMGNRLLVEGKSNSSFYVPTANILVRRDIFMSTGSFRAGMRLGEDVDFCWRLRHLDRLLLYAPFGRVAHKHRHRLDKMLKRIFEYGTSEASLYRIHRDKRKTFVIPVFAGLSFLALALAVLLFNPYPLCPIPLFFGLDLWGRSKIVNKYKMGLTLNHIIYSSLRSYLSFFYFAFFHLIRYYLVLYVGLGFLWFPLWIFGGLAIILASVVDYHAKKPPLFYPVFLFFYLLEHLAYQLGVFWGCLKKGFFGSYLLKFRCA